MEAHQFIQNNLCQQFPSDGNKTNNTEQFMVEDLLDFPNDDDTIVTDTTFDSVPGNSTDSSTITINDSCNSTSFSGSEPNLVTHIGCQNLAEGHFAGDLCIPDDDLAELEWLSNFVEESFSSEDLQKLELISGMKARNDDTSHNQRELFQPKQTNRNNPLELLVPTKTRCKRSRRPPCNWTSRLLILTPMMTSPENNVDVIIPTPTFSSVVIPVAKKKLPRKRDGGGDSSGGDGHRCLHCATDKTPQWRTGPMGPKTLCNACGVRYKSGRLVPEYRPAASPTFVLTKHSNSHRKVMELRRQKEMVMGQHHHHHHQQQQQQQFLLHHHHQGMMYDVSHGDDYLIHQHVGPNFMQLI
ncbi:hypothetical protein RIF29_27005 [Crotalaria pallida]|uniref:GATA transcription factor n=1 Tax=Crotalaria pallida TaxID=3830 RepID=A0AAN9ENV5_CROPI